MYIPRICYQLLVISWALGGNNLKTINLQEWWGPANITEADRSVRRFQIQWDSEMLSDLKYRLTHHRSLKQPLQGVGAFEYGFNTNTLDKILNYWINEYNYTERLEYLNQHAQYKTNIQGLDVHFIWVKPEPLPSLIKVVPILLLHGWPGLNREFYELIPLLTKFRPGHEFVFEVIAPSLVGFGYSDAPNRVGFGTIEMATVFRNLMKRLGHSKYYVQGGDWGGIIGSTMATIFYKEVLGFHTNMPVALNKRFIFKYILGKLKRDDIDPRFEHKMYPIIDKIKLLYTEMGYFNQHTSKPDTFGIILNESPVSLAAYLLEFFAVGTNLNNRLIKDGGLYQYDIKNLLDFVMIYWDSGSISTSVRHYANCMRFQRNYSVFELNEMSTAVPTWALHLTNEPLFFPITLMKEKYTNILGYTFLEKGGHFAAFELPNDTANDIWKAVSHFEMFWKRKIV